MKQTCFSAYSPHGTSSETWLMRHVCHLIFYNIFCGKDVISILKSLSIMGSSESDCRDYPSVWFVDEEHEV